MPTSYLGDRGAVRPAALLLTLLALVVAPLTLTPSSAQAAVNHLVISEVYGSGGLAGATFKNDFVELYNPTSADISLAGTSLQYRSNANTGTGNQALTGTVKAHSHFLVQEAAGEGGSQDLENPDATGSLDLSGTGGTVFLANVTTLVTLTAGTSTANPAVIDLVGWGSSTTFETKAAPQPTNPTAVTRNANRDDTDNNSHDFSVATPEPQSSTSGEVDPGPAVDRTINQIQGTGATSPLVGTKVTTSGVVTASYKTGGLKGFTLQKPGSGGDLDLSEHTGSDAVFVYVGGLAAAAYPEVGDHVEVTGTVKEVDGLTEVSTGSAADITTLTSIVTPPTPASAPWPAGAAARESLESMLYLPSGPWTVAEVFNLNTTGEIDLARGDTPLRVPTDVARPSTPAAALVAAQNAARSVTLDDGAALNYLTTAKDTPLPWITPNSSVRVGAGVTFNRPVIVTESDGWKFEPTAQLDAVDSRNVKPALFTDTRTAHPATVDGQLKIASFNVLNYFTQTAADWTGRPVTPPNTCTSFKDRTGTPITVDGCNGDGPRGAWDEANRIRQQDKIVKAINALGADVLSLEEIENSAKYGPDRDAALSTLVDALNADLGDDVWSFVPSPNPGQRPALAEEDVIRTAFIYKHAKVEPVGKSRILTGSAAFANAREPLAQAFKPKGGAANQQFLAIVNHFKSKSSGTGADADQGDGQGASNASRVAQAKALVGFVDTMKAATGTQRVFLTGDFNAYTKEDPLKVLTDAGFTDIGSTVADGYTYVFDGEVGSLDHVLANSAALDTVRGASVWNINSVESVAYEYSRYHYNATDFYAPGPFRSSDHDPLLVGFDSPPAAADPIDLNLLSINDFHGRIDTNTTAFATTVEQLRESGGEDNTLFLAAGDNIGASLFASATADDNPTIDVLNALGMDASAVGNHEFDKGFADLTGHVKNRADWTYLGANVYEKGTQTPALPEYAIIDRAGLKVGVIGAVTQETPSLVSPAGITSLDFGDPVAAVNRVTNQLTDGNEANGEADVIVAEFHAGAPAGTPDGATFEQEVATGGEFTHIVQDLSPKVAAIFTGHTHKQYAWDAPVPGQPGKIRPIMQTGEYGGNVGQIRLHIDPTTHAVLSYQQAVVPRGASVDLTYPRVAAVKSIVDAALADAAVIGNVVKGQVSKDITTAYAGGSYVDGVYKGPNTNGDPKAGRDARELESALGNKVADALLDNLSENGAEISIVNPGGLRDELFYQQSVVHEGDGNVTYAEANAVLPFVNNLWTVDLTGAQLKTVLEQQWQPTGAQRPFLHLGLSKNVSVALDPSKPTGQHVVSIEVNGKQVEPTDVFTVGTFSFLATGGDNFTEFKNGTNAVDTGKVDRDAWIAYITGHSPLAPDFARREVEGSGIPTSITPDQAVSFGLSRLDLTSIGSPQNTSVKATLDTPGTDTELGTFPVTNGAATVTFTAPHTVPADSSYVFTALPSGTTLRIPAVTGGGSTEARATTTTARISSTKPVVRSTELIVKAQVNDADGAVDGGDVEVRNGTKVLATAAVSNGAATLHLPAFAATGTATLTVRYAGTATEKASAAKPVKVTVVAATPTLTSVFDPAPRKNKTSVLTVRVAAQNGVPSGKVVVREGSTVLGSGFVGDDGRVKVVMPKYTTSGKRTITISYGGSPYVEPATRTVSFTIY